VRAGYVGIALAVIRGNGLPSGLITGVYSRSDRNERPPMPPWPALMNAQPTMSPGTRGGAGNVALGFLPPFGRRRCFLGILFPPAGFRSPHGRLTRQRPDPGGFPRSAHL